MLSKKGHILTFSFLFLFLFMGNVKAESPPQPRNIRFEHPVNLGFSIQSLTQDNDGFLWIGTSDGIFRYDGHNLKKYTAGKKGLSTNYAPNVFVDSEGIIWIGTVGGGLNRYNKSDNSFTVFKHDPGDIESISSNNFNWKPGMAAEDKEGLLWFGTQNGLNCFNKKTGKFKRFLNNPENSNSLSDNYIWCIAVDREDFIWIGTKKGGLNSYNKKTDSFKHYKSDPYNENSLNDDEVLGITEDSKGMLWIGTKEGGLSRFDKSNGQFTHFWHDPDHPYSLSNDEVSHITEDSFGDLWLSRTYSTAAGLEKFERKTERFITYKNNPDNPGSISGNSVIQSFEDSSGTMWFVENNGQLNKYDRKSRLFDNYRHNSKNDKSISSDTITTIMEDSDGDIWMGSFLGGVNRFNTKTDTFISYKNDPEDIDSFLHNYAFSIFEDSEKTIWVGTDDGILNIFDKKSGKIIKRFQNPHSTQVARSIIEDGTNSDFLWFGTEADGLFRFNKKTGAFKQYLHDSNNPESISCNSMFLLFQSPDKTIWIATFGGGLCRYIRNTDSFESYQHNPKDPTSISSNIVNDCLIDKSGTFWVGTDEGGLNEFDPSTGKFTSYIGENNFPTSAIKGIVEDNAGKLWIGLNSGILRFNPKLKKIEKIFTKSDGLPSNKMSMFATGAYKTSDGRIWFATVADGIVAFYPDQIVNNHFIPPVVLTSFKQGHSELVFNSSTESVREIELSWLYNFFEFEFSALSYTQPEKNQFKYILEGFDKDWFYSGTRRFGRYSGLPDGNYTLKILGSNNDGVWNNEGVSIKISVTPPIWRSWWAYLLYVSTITGLIIFLVINQKQTLEHEKLINARLRAVDKLKDEIFTSTSHELKTPLNAIIGLTDSLIDGVAGELNDSVKSNLFMVSLSGRRLLNLVNDILDYSRLKHKKLQIQSQVVDMRILTDVVMTISRALILKKDIKFQNLIPENAIFAKADENRVQQILYNLIGNAIKFTEKGSITINASVDKSEINISVSDTGIGIAPEDQAGIFESFEQVDGSTSREYGGTGLGLAVSQRLVELHGGKLGVNSRIGEGSTFYFTLPKAKDYFVSKTTTSPGEHLAISQMASDLTETQKSSVTKTDQKLCKKILVVDDELINLQVVDNYLSMENYLVVKISSGSKVLPEIEKGIKTNNPYDLILLDVMMPVMSGYEVCKEIRKKYPPDILPIIMLTAKNRVSDLVAGLEAGANDYLAKPFQKEELLARIKALLPLKELVVEREKAKNDLKELNTTLEKKVDERTGLLELTNKELQNSLKLLKSTQEHIVQTEKMTALGSLVAGIAHEISTPVGICVTAASFLEMKTKNIINNFDSGNIDTVKTEKYFKAASEASSIMMANLNRAAELIQGFKQIAVDQTSGDKRDFNISEYLNEIVTSLQPRYKRLQPDINILCPKELSISSFPGAFAQIVTNLIVNTIVHGFENKKAGEGLITIEASRKKNMLVIIYSDNGQGMEKNIVKRIFDPFFTTKRGAQGGSGLGMHIVFNLVTQTLNGTISCNSSDGKGAKFIISVPF